MRPTPEVPQASSPSAGPTVWMPHERRVARLRCTAGWAHMRLFMAGAIRTGLPEKASSSVDKASSAMPEATLPMMLAVAGATTNMSPQSLSEMCSVPPEAKRSL